MSGRLKLAALAGGFALLIVVTGCVSTDRPAARPPLPAPAAPPTAMTASAGSAAHLAPISSQEYVGDSACAACHADIWRQHHDSAHATTLRAVTLSSDGALFQSPQIIRDNKEGDVYRLGIQNGDCVMMALERSGQETLQARYAFGSGRYGRTYLGKEASGQWIELRMTYYTRLHRWDFTPFLQPDPDHPQNPDGLALNAPQLAFCFSCHVTTLKMGPNEPDAPESHFGVGCERCHGPGRQHLEAAHALLAGKNVPSLKMQDLITAPREKIMAACGECHSGPSDIPVDARLAVILARFAATALQQSRCYLQSPSLSCITCHDPHTLKQSKTASYEAVCLNCHGTRRTPQEGNGLPGTASLAQNKPPLRCKVSPRSGCIRCHMPVQSTRSFALVGFHNHWIRIYPKLQPGS
ncbi:MAG TPA: cytochrome c3 family protein [Chthonomonadaceae bacterium]|nr:cytochrome c3 family protein [Chthonomonadaceae bacterium]